MKWEFKSFSLAGHFQRNHNLLLLLFSTPTKWPLALVHSATVVKDNKQVQCLNCPV